jgi:sortase A
MPPAGQTDELSTFQPGGAAPPPAIEGSLVGRVEIPRLGVSSLVLEGVAGSTLRHGVGHIPRTSLPQQPGNVGLAGHRDTVFRALQDVRPGDLILLDTLAGSYRYQVDWTRIVQPDDVSVLAAAARAELTLVTCYPFHYVGSAPERFIVRGHRVDDPGASTGAGFPIASR